MKRIIMALAVCVAVFMLTTHVAVAAGWYNMSFYTDMQFGNGDEHVCIQNSNDKWDFYDWISYTDGGNNTRDFRVRYHDDGLKPTGYYPILGGYEDANAGTDVDDFLAYADLWYVPIYLFAGGVNQMDYLGINESDEAVWEYVSGDWKLVSKITGFDQRYTITSSKFVSTSDWDATKKSDVDRLWGDDDYYLDTAKDYPFFNYDLAGDGNANGLFDAGDINVMTSGIVLTSGWQWIGTGDPGSAPDMPYVNIEADQIGEPIPEPISMIFFGTGLVAVGGFVSRRRMRRSA